MTFTNFTIERSNANGQNIYNGTFTGTPEQALEYQARKLGIECLPVTETADYFRVCTPQGQLALTVAKETRKVA